MATTSEGTSVMVQGRIVWLSGDLFKGRQKTDPNTRQPIMNQDGTPKMEYGFGLAVPKSVLSQAGPGQPGAVWAAMHEEAYKIFPSRQLPPSFAWKYKDGDGVDHNGASFATREGYAGNIVLACTTQIPIKFFRFENGQNFQINEGIKCGDYVNVQLSVKAHPAIGQGKPGLYLNPNAVQFLGYGPEIVNTPSGDAIFGLSAPSVPQGASATPIAPAGMLMPQGAPPAAGGFPMPSAAPQAPPAPHWGVVPQSHQPSAPAPIPAAPGPVPMTQGFPAPAPAFAGNAPAAPGGFPMPPGFGPR